MHADAHEQLSSPEGERFYELWRHHHGEVLAYALRRLGNEHAAEEVVADTFLVAWRRRDSVPNPTRPWLLGVARKQLANRRRGDQRRAALIAKVAASAEPVIGGPPSDLSAVLAAAFNSLSVSDREVLALVAWDELKPREAAAVLNMTPALFSVRLHRARRRLRKRLAAARHATIGDRQPNPAADSPGPHTVRMEIE
jgi:RNA polymerase sigma factor (sigma-70 family)